MQVPRPLSQLELHRKLRIVSVEGEEALASQLEEQGFVSGEEVELTARGIFGGSPLAVKIGRAVVALRRTEADALMVVPL
jgi:ferrous iron transport protein A